MVLNGKTTGILVLLSLSYGLNASATTLKGQVQLDDKVQQVEVHYGADVQGEERIVVGQYAYPIVGRLDDQYLAHRVWGQTRPIADVVVTVLTDPVVIESIRKDPLQASQGWNLTQLVHCAPTDNAFLVIRDNLKAPYLGQGNCLRLTEETR
jgi:hypothetical protein